MAYRLILYEKSPPIGRIILNQPQKLNPLSNALRDEFEAALADAEAVARRAASLIAEQARETVAERGRFTLATSGGATPRLMLRLLAGEDLPWPQVHIFQVDERVAPAGHPDRNLAQNLFWSFQ